MIISASRRTDIPAFYSEWFMNRVRSGYCCTVNPFNANQVARVSLEPADVGVIVFWTKDARPMIPHVGELSSLGFRFYFQYTINDYQALLEPGVPPLNECIEAFKELSSLIGPDKVIWRYDPIVLSDLTPEDYHLRTFERIASALSGSTHRVVISISDEYRAAKGRLQRLDIGYREPDLEDAEFAGMLRAMVEIAGREGMEILSCAEVYDLTPFGIQPGKCVDDAYIRKVFGIDVTHRKDKNQRLECGCVQSKDIGQYDTCRHGCAYCYATRSDKLVDGNTERHYPDSPLIVGRYDPPEAEPVEVQKSLF
jgi:hypothetical protein